MPRTKNHTASPAAARSAPSPAPTPGAGTAPGDPAAAVTAALAAHPGGATTTVLASAAGISRAAARDALAVLETAGAAKRTRGGRPGIPDSWRPATPAATREPEGPAGDPAADAATAGEPAPPGPVSATANPGPDDSGSQDTAGGIGPSAPEAPAEASDGGRHPAGDSAGAFPDPAVTAQLAGHAGQIETAGAAVTAALQAGDLRAALAGIEEISDQAGQARRILKAALGGAKAHAVRSGGLREKVAAHLRSHPGQDFTPHDIHKVLGNSSGAIANALDTLVKLGEAELSADKPRKFRHAATGPATDPATGDAATAGGAASTDDGQPLAGAA